MVRKPSKGYNFTRAPLQRKILLHIAENKAGSIRSTSQTLKKSYKSVNEAHHALKDSGLLRTSSKFKSYEVWWLTRKGIGVAIVEGAKIDRMEELASAFYDGEELSKVKLTLQYGRAFGAESFGYLRNFEFSKIRNIDMELLLMVINNPDLLKVAEEMVSKKQIPPYFTEVLKIINKEKG